jgi:Glycosyltransferase family 10 (fucosyltransferase) C-term
MEWPDFCIDDVMYSPRLPLDEADALIVLYDPCEELLNFGGPKLWFTIEPSWHHHFNSDSIGKKLIRSLAADERAYFANPLASCRVPHPTYNKELTRPRADASRNAAVACVNNFGGRLWFLKRHFKLRNRFILSPTVMLFGNPESWATYRHFPRVWIRRPPDNFQGKSSPGQGYFDDAYIQFLSGYTVAICLENCTEERYFTEKFVNAVRAGCIPIYHAHPTVKAQFLTGAKWVDPADFNMSPSRTIEFALAQDQAEYRRVNDLWLESGVLTETDNDKVFLKLHQIIMRRLLHSHDNFRI